MKVLLYGLQHDARILSATHARTCNCKASSRNGFVDIGGVSKSDFLPALPAQLTRYRFVNLSFKLHNPTVALLPFLRTLDYNFR
jgi:hypothetical protein